MGFERWFLIGAFLIFLIYPAACARHPGGPVRPESPKSPEPSAPGFPVGADFRVFDARGGEASLSDIAAAAEAVSVVFLGEEHGNPVGHRLQAELLRMFHGKIGERRPVVLAMEMFARDVQLALDEYLGDFIAERHFLRAARAWPGYATDYRPLVEYAKAHGLSVFAGNAPRRYVNRVSRLGADSLADLPAASRAFLPPLPFGDASDAYRERFRTFWGAMAGHAGKGDGSSHGHEAEADETFERFLAAQALWDASMADVAAKILDETPDALVVHVNGKFHSAAGLGIPEHLVDDRPGTRFLVVTFAAPASFPEFDPGLAGEGDFVVLTDPARSRRSGSPHG
jgi:uncharacterized iron-regulated protein